MGSLTDTQGARPGGKGSPRPPVPHDTPGLRTLGPASPLVGQRDPGASGVTQTGLAPGPRPPRGIARGGRDRKQGGLAATPTWGPL